MTSSRCVVVVVALFVSLRVSLPTQGEKGRGKKFCCFCEVLCVKSFAKRRAKRDRTEVSSTASLSLEEQKPKKKKHRRLRKSSE